jgi:peptidoglycan-N-acetylglucosamine deacetylase
MVWTNPSPLRFLFPWILWKGDPQTEAVHLTFDDGPDPAHTPPVLDWLRGEGIRAAFFLNGAKTLQAPGIVERIHREGHCLGNHGFSHRRLDFRPGRLVLDEIRRTDEAVFRITGEKPRGFRPPYGRFDPRFRKWMEVTGHRLVLWSLIPCDYLGPPPEALVSRVGRHLHPGAIILLHDGHPNAPHMLKALPGMLEKIRSAGLSIHPLEP